MHSNPRMTLVICTHNRSALLRRCLEGVLRQHNLDRLEVVVVDNASIDDTPEAYHQFARDMPSLRYVYEATPGLSCARNRGLCEARCDLIGYLDDDVIPDPNWAETIIDAFDRTDADAVGGRTTLYWDRKPQWWFSKGLYHLLGTSDYGEDTLINIEGYHPNGGNMAFRTRLLRNLGGFNTDLGVVSTNGRETTTYLGEDSRVGIEIARAKGTIVYCGQALVRHYVDERRCNLRALYNRSLQLGRTRAVLGVADASLCEDELVWTISCVVSSLCRFRLRNAIAFYMRCLTSYTTHKELHRHESTISSISELLKAVVRQRRGIAGLMRRTLFGQPLPPPEQ